MLEFLIVISATCFAFGVIYPLCAIIIYPIYRFFGGKYGLRDYIKSL